MRNGIGAFQIFGGYFDKNIYGYSIAALFTQEISIIKECKFIPEIEKNSQFARTDDPLAGYFMESIMA
jgi:hypothetical protein